MQDPFNYDDPAWINAVAQYNASERTSMSDAYAKVQDSNARAAQIYAELQNIGNVQALSNQSKYLANQRQYVDNQGAAIENVGKALKNQGQFIQNVIDSLDIPLKQLYIASYDAYRQAYTEYTGAMESVYKKMEQTARSTGLALRAIRDYQRKTQICESRKRRLSRHKMLIANEELRNKEIYLSNLQRTFLYFTKSPIGEQCVHKTLLTWRNQDMRHLFEIEYQVEIDESGYKPMIACPAIADDFPGEFDSFEYPPPILNKETYEPLGYYQPVTYYQIFRLLTETSMNFKVQNPPIASKGCNRFIPGTRKYFELSRELESDMADDRLAEILVDPVTSDYSTGYRVASKYDNKSYNKLLADFSMIFEMADKCQEMQKAELEEQLAVDSQEAPFKAGDPAISNLNSYFDPNFAKFSESINECMYDAEHFRYKAFAFLDTQEKMVAVLNTAAAMAAPQPPAPTQFQAVPDKR